MMSIERLLLCWIGRDMSSSPKS